MKLKITFFLLFLTQVLIAQKTNQSISKANELFKSGRFEEARTLLSENAEKGWNLPTQYTLARIELLSNRFANAETLLTTILDKHPNDSLASKLLAETYYRQDDYSHLPGLLANAKSTYRIRQIEHFVSNNLIPYHMERQPKRVVIKMETVDFLPSIKVQINGYEGLFIIDTGGGTTILDTEFAKEVGVLIFDEKEAIYAGGAKAKTRLGYAKELKIGRITIKNLPIHVQGTQQYAQAVGGRPVMGIIGTNLLYHFISTIDYQNGELILQKRDIGFNRKKAIEIPMWLASDHLILAKGKLKEGDEQLFLVDTGMAGAGFTAPKSTLDAAKIKPAAGGSFEGQGAGGAVTVTPFMIDKISLGELSNSGTVVGLYGPFPPTLESSLGFRIGGLISHTFFKPFKITFNFEKMLIYAEK